MADQGRRRRSRWVKAAAIIVLLLVWEGGAHLVGSTIILPTPEATLLALVRLVATSGFWSAVGATVLRGAVGFAVSFIAAVVIGVAAGASSVVRSGVSPLLTLLRATPVMSVILLALIWFQTNSVPVFVAFLMVFPILCGNVIEGVRNVDPGLLKMAKLYRVRRSRVIGGIYLPNTIPYLIAGLSSAVGITWKVVVAAEVLSQPLHAVGSGLQLAKYRLDTASVFAWTAVAVVLTAISEQLIERIDRRIPWRRSLDGD